jgi:glycosyltransferase involved in cell wall biosynthesis
VNVVVVGCLGPGTQKPSGVSNYVRNILPELSRIGIDVKLIGVGPKPDLSLPYEFVSLRQNSGISSFGFSVRLLASNPSFALASDSVINAHRPDDLIPFLLLEKKNPKVMTLHGTHFRNVYIKRGRAAGKLYDFLERYSVRRTNQIITVSKVSREIFLKRYPEKKEFIHHIPPGLDTSLFRPLDRSESKSSLGFDTDDFVILYAGRLEKDKRLEWLLEAFARVKKKKRSAKLLLVGDGRETPRLEAVASSRKEEDICLLGSAQQSEMPRLMSASDVFCLLSMHEGFPSVILEALACGLPVVSSRVGDVPEVVQEEVSGSIVDVLEPSEIANRLLDVGSHRDSMAADCIKTAQAYSWQKTAESTVEVYREACA